MNIIFILTLVVCLLDLSAGARLRENSNVLVPNNDANLQAKIKKLLNGDDEVDPEDFSDNEIESLSEMKFPKVEKLRSKSLPNPNIVFDDKNKNIEENKIESEVPDLDVIFESSEEFADINRFNSNGTTPQYTFATTNTTNHTETNPTFATTNTTNHTETTPTFTITSYESNTTVSTLIPESATNSSATTLSTNGTTTSTANSNSTTTPWNMTTTPVNETLTTSVPHSTSAGQNETTFEMTTKNATESVSPINATTPISETTHAPSTPSTDSTSDSPVVTTTEPIFDNLEADECLLGKAERYLKWVNVDGRLNRELIEEEFDVKYEDLSRNFTDISPFNNSLSSISNLTFLSASFNNLTRLPHDLLDLSSSHLKYLSLAGNNFAGFCQDLDPRHHPCDRDHEFCNSPKLEQLDMRNCRLKSISDSFVSKLLNLEYLYLSHNFITEVSAVHMPPFPVSLIHLDMSYNNVTDESQEGLILPDGAFEGNGQLRSLDFSFTKLRTSRLNFLNFLPANLTQLSLCYTELPRTLSTNGSFKLEVLDLSGNRVLELDLKTFALFASTLKYLHIRNSIVKNLNWAVQLDNLRALDLMDNNIHVVNNLSFSHMAFLTKLNLERNSIGNWFERLFENNHQLEILNLRGNKLAMLSEDMKQDLLSVNLLAIGGNEFICNCRLQELMHDVSEASKNSNVSIPFRYTDSIPDYEYDDGVKVAPESIRVSLGVRSYLKPEYDVISRTYQKYYEMAEESVQAFRSKSLESPDQLSSRALIMKSNADQGSEVVSSQTILFDYNGNDDDYECRDSTTQKKQPMITMSSFCSSDHEFTTEGDDGSIYNSNKRNTFLALSIAIPLVIFVTILLIIVYWKWWYIKYFFTLCKNSAILTFMDDSDDSDEAIIKKNDDTLETYLYDVFVSYCDQNRNWVLDEFIPNVEKRESINVCLHERDFQVGHGILENIVSCMDRSRCLLLLVSENFLLSQWCQFEMNLAQHRLLETRRDKLILVLLEDIPSSNQPKTLKYLMRTKTYIKWPGSGTPEEKQLFWKRLKKSIISSKWETENYGSVA